MLDAIVVGNVIQELREKKGLSQEVVSGLAGIGRTHLSAVERGERKPRWKPSSESAMHSRLSRVS